MQLSETEKIWPLLFRAGRYSNFSEEEKQLFGTGLTDQEMAGALRDPEHMNVLMDQAKVVSERMTNLLNDGVPDGQIKDLVEQAKRQADIVYSALRMYRIAPISNDKLHDVAARINAEWTKHIDDTGIVDWIIFRGRKYGSPDLFPASSKAKGKRIEASMEEAYDRAAAHK